MMNGQELSTAVREQIPIKIIVCDNNVHGSILKGKLINMVQKMLLGLSWKAQILLKSGEPMEQSLGR